MSSSLKQATNLYRLCFGMAIDSSMRFWPRVDLCASTADRKNVSESHITMTYTMAEADTVQ